MQLHAFLFTLDRFLSNHFALLRLFLKRKSSFPEHR
jgi:hypothetical protein